MAEKKPAATAPTPPASPADKRGLPLQIEVEVVEGKLPVLHPQTGETLATGSTVVLQHNFADVYVRTGRAKYIRPQDHPRNREAANKLGAVKGA